jgi:hypothetical protein
MNAPTPFDPKGLMKDAFEIEGITAAECRSIFLDWVLGVPAGADVRAEVKVIVAHYASLADADHPMLATLTAAQEDTGPPRRTGGRQSRILQRTDDTSF